MSANSAFFEPGADVGQLFQFVVQLIVKVIGPQGFIAVSADDDPGFIFAPQVSAAVARHDLVAGQLLLEDLLHLPPGLIEEIIMPFIGKK